MTRAQARHATGSRQGPDTPQIGLGWREFTQSLGRNRVTIVAVLLVAVQVWWKSNALAHSYFQQDDFQFTARALEHRLGYGYLFRLEAGQLTPGSFAAMWVLARVSLYDWGLWGGTMLALQTLAGLAMLRALRTLCGNRPAILVPLAVFLFTPLTLSNMTWFAAGIIAIPLQIAIPMAVDAHVRYVRGRRVRHAVLAGFWTLFGMAFYEKAAVIALLLFALTSAFLMAGGWRRAMAHSLRQYWQIWAGYATLILADVAVYLYQLGASPVGPRAAASAETLSFGANLITKTFVPGALGGPWVWGDVGGARGLSATPAGLLWAAWVAAALIVGVSLWFRRHAWRSWAILLGWLVVADVVPIAVGRLSFFGLALAQESHYVADAAAVLAICLALAFLPVDGERDAYRARLPWRWPARLAATAALVIFAAGSAWSMSTFVDDERPQVDRSYIATASAALAAAPQGSVIINQNVPAEVLDPFLAGSNGYSHQSHVLGPLAAKLRTQQIRWTYAPDGKIDNLMIFDSLGRLHPVVVAGATSPPRHGCYLPTTRGVVIPLTGIGPAGGQGWTMRIGYFGNPDIQLAISFGGYVHLVTLPASGLSQAYLQVQGGGSSVLIRKITPGGGVCIGDVAIGRLQPSPTATSIPAWPVPG